MSSLIQRMAIHDLQEEVERLQARVKELENGISNIPDCMSEATNREMIDAIAAAKGLVKLEDKND